MKRLTIIAVIITLLLYGCTASPAPDESKNPVSPDSEVSQVPSAPQDSPQQAQSPEASAKPQGYPFTANGQEMYISMEAQPVLSALPEPLDIFEAPSCAFDGVDITYFYPGFELTTYPENGKEHILSIVLTDDSVTTPEGVYIGGMTEEIFAAYGSGYTEMGGQITYTKDTASLVFNTQDGVITGISYMLIIAD